METDVKQVNWAADPVGNVVVGKSYRDRAGNMVKITHQNDHLFYPANRELNGSVYADGRYLADTDQRHKCDLIEEVKPRKLKMWMNEGGGIGPGLFETKADATTGPHPSRTRIGVPVWVTEIEEGDDGN